MHHVLIIPIAITILVVYYWLFRCLPSTSATGRHYKQRSIADSMAFVSIPLNSLYKSIDRNFFCLTTIQKQKQGKWLASNPDGTVSFKRLPPGVAKTLPSEFLWQWTKTRLGSAAWSLTNGMHNFWTIRVLDISKDGNPKLNEYDALNIGQRFQVEQNGNLFTWANGVRYYLGSSENVHGNGNGNNEELLLTSMYDIQSETTDTEALMWVIE